MKKCLLCNSFAILNLICSSAYAAVPLTFTHHGMLKEDGNSVNDTRTITATIISNTGVIVGQQTAKVIVENGLYSLTIENINAEKAAAAKDLALRITVEDQELTPALKITSVPYALISKVAESVKTAPINAAGLYIYNKEGEAQTNITVAEDEICPCDKDANDWDCSDSFSDMSYDRSGCYDQYGPAYQYYRQGGYLQPVDVVAIEHNTIGIGTAQADAPLHILANYGENGNYDIHVADANPRILLEDLDGDSVEITADDGTLAVSGKVEGEDFGDKLLKKLLNRIYPVGSIYTSVNLATPEAVAAVIGGKWERLPTGRVLWGVDSGAGSTIDAGLPNITGDFNGVEARRNNTSTGVFKNSSVISNSSDDGSSGARQFNIHFSAADSNGIYGKSTTVQPPAYTVYMYKRIAD